MAIEAYHAVAEAIRGSTIDGALHEIRVSQIGLEVVQRSATPGKVRLRHFGMEAVRHKPLPPSWLPNYVFDGTYWVPLFSTIGTPHEGSDRPYGTDEPFALRAPDGSRWRLTVASDGTLTTEEIIDPALEIVSVSHTNLSGTTTSALTVNRPEGVQDGDLLLANVVHTNHGGQSTPPAGWSLLRSDPGSVGTGDGIPTQQEIWYRDASSEPSTYVWSHSSDYRTLAGIVAVRNQAFESGVVIEHSGSRLASTGSSNINKFSPTLAIDGPARLKIIFSHCSINHSSSSWSSSITEPLWSGRMMYARYAYILASDGITDEYPMHHSLSWWPFGGNHDGATQSVLVAPGA